MTPYKSFNMFTIHDQLPNSSDTIQPLLVIYSKKDLPRSTAVRNIQ